jgi:dsDNA-specific endonuclease/ATPase MutS2
MIDDVSLREHLESKIAALEQHTATMFAERATAVNAALAAAEKAVTAALVAAKEAVNKAETAQEKRNEGMNEFRKAMSDQQASLAPKGETDLRLAAIEKRLDLSAGKTQGITASGVFLAATVSVLVGVVTLYLATRGAP